MTTAFDRFRDAILRDARCANNRCDKPAQVIGLFHYNFANHPPKRIAYCKKCADLMTGMFTPDFADQRK